MATESANFNGVRDMLRMAGLILSVFLWSIGDVGHADPPTILHTGEWSKAVSDTRGNSVRGRLVLGGKGIGEGRRAIIVYVELEDASSSVRESMRIFCDMGRTDFRPEYNPGLHCELLDKDKKPVPSQGFPFSGAVPRSEWISLPADAAIRLRATPFGIHRPGAMAICPHLGKLWVINDGDPNEYFLAGRFIADPNANQAGLNGGNVWRGTLQLPPIRIVNSKK